jgi:hypothetical protein
MKESLYHYVSRRIILELEGGDDDSIHGIVKMVFQSEPILRGLEKAWPAS